MKCDHLDWQVTATMERIVASMTFDNFDQSMRFMSVLTNFLREEKALAEASRSAASSAGQNEVAEQGQISCTPFREIRADG